MENRFYIGENETVVRKIVVEFNGKGGEKGHRSIVQLIGMIAELQNQLTPEEIDTLHSQITGYCKCCMDNEFIDKKAADDLMAAVAITAAIEMERARSEVKK